MVDSTLGVRVALIGRNSTCKSLFLKAASSSDRLLPDTASDAEVWWTSPLAPREADLAHNPEHGFAPSGERLLPAQLNHASAASVLGEESKQSDGDRCEQAVADAARQGAGEATPAVLMVVGAEMAFHKGYPRPNRGGVTPVKAAVSRVRERLGGGQVPLAVAVSFDVEWDGGPSQSTAMKAFLESVKDEMALEGVPIVAVSPRTELWLREQKSEGGRVSYRRGDYQFRIHPAFESLMDKEEITNARAAFDVCGGTGILAAVSTAIGLNPPTLVFPVGDFLTLQSSGWCGDGAPVATLRTCRLMRGNSSARDLFAVEKKEGILAGELVGAEASLAPTNSAGRAEPLPIDLDAPIGNGAWLVRLAGSRKAAKMWNAGPAAATGGKGGKPLASVQFGDLRSKDRRRGKS
ncbi:unnamed protein product [Ectocarpus sp. 12 AP-2014]